MAPPLTMTGSWQEEAAMNGDIGVNEGTAFWAARALARRRVYDEGYAYELLLDDIEALSFWEARLAEHCGLPNASFLW